MTGIPAQVNPHKRDSLVNLIDNNVAKVRKYQDSFLHRQDSTQLQQLTQTEARNQKGNKEKRNTIQSGEGKNYLTRLLAGCTGLVVLLVLFLADRKRARD